MIDVVYHHLLSAVHYVAEAHEVVQLRVLSGQPAFERYQLESQVSQAGVPSGFGFVVGVILVASVGMLGLFSHDAACG